jgi:hypothetical protein
MRDLFSFFFSSDSVKDIIVPNDRFHVSAFEKYFNGKGFITQKSKNDHF